MGQQQLAFQGLRPLFERSRDELRRQTLEAFVSGQVPSPRLTAEVDDIVTNIQVILETCPNACTSNPKLGIDLPWQHACSTAGVAQEIAQTLVSQLSQSEPRLESLAVQHLATLSSRGPFLVIQGSIRGAASVLELRLTLRSQRQLVLDTFTVLPV